MDCSPLGSSVHGFPRQEYWNGLPFLPLGNVPNPGIEPVSLVFPALAGGFFITASCGKPERYERRAVNVWTNLANYFAHWVPRLLIRKPHLDSTVCFKNTTNPIRSQDIFCFFIFVVCLNFKWISTTAVLLKQGYCFWGSCRWLLTGWNRWGTRLFHEFKFLDIKKRNEPDSFLQQQYNSST